MKLNWKFQRGGEVQTKKSSMWGVWIFSGTTHCKTSCFFKLELIFFNFLPVINILGKSVNLNEVDVHTSSDVAVENTKNNIHNQVNSKQDCKPRYWHIKILFLF